MKYLLKNGSIVTSSGVIKGDILISDGLIQAIGNYIWDESAVNFDVEGNYILPGLIDSHVHIGHPNKYGNATDDFYTASVAAARSGVTMFMDFAIQWDQNDNIYKTAVKKDAQIKKESIIDYSFHNCPTLSEPITLSPMRDLENEGLPSFKFYMTYSKQNRMASDGLLLEALKKSREHNCIVGVHAENDSMILYNEKVAEAANEIGYAYFPKYKPPYIEEEAINRVIQMNETAEGHLFIFHVTTGKGAAMVKKAREAGQSIYAETCVHYLVLNDDKYLQEDGYKYLCSPPLRSDKDRDELWKALNNNALSIVTSDHCGFSHITKENNKDDFRNIPNGLPGIDARLNVLYTEGVVKGRISIEKMAELTSTNAAKIFGCFPQKGIIQVGSDADLVVFNPRHQKLLRNKELNNSTDWSPYEGMELHGKVEMTFSRGELIVENDVVSAAPGRGQRVMRKLNL